ncbi:MAG TPA: cytochrome c [Alphaproteobacteria bacterium]|jgi:cytochrome c5|nr:cytochrome c [Alphaproteobacteria bacterium]
MRHLLLVAALATLAAPGLVSPAAADEAQIKLKDGPGKEAVETNCAGCHSLDYIPMNSPFLDRGKWDATIKKMIGPLGAPIDAKDVPAILDYLAKNYGSS